MSDIFVLLTELIYNFKDLHGYAPVSIYVGTQQWHDMKYMEDQFRMRYREDPEGTNYFDNIPVYIVMDYDHMVAV